MDECLGLTQQEWVNNRFVPVSPSRARAAEIIELFTVGLIDPLFGQGDTMPRLFRMSKPMLGHCQKAQVPRSRAIGGCRLFEALHRLLIFAPTVERGPARPSTPM